MDRTNETNENETENQCLNGQDLRNQRNQCLSKRHIGQRERMYTPAAESQNPVCMITHHVMCYRHI